MRSLQDEIRRTHATLACPICQRKFALEEIIIKTDRAYLSAELRVICDQGHYPLVLIVPCELHQKSRTVINDRLIKHFDKQIDRISSFGPEDKGLSNK